MHGESVRVFSRTAAPAALFVPAVDDAIIPCLLASPKYRDAGAKIKRVLGLVDALVSGDLLLRWRPGSVASCRHRLSTRAATTGGRNTRNGFFENEVIARSMARRRGIAALRQCPPRLCEESSAALRRVSAAKNMQQTDANARDHPCDALSALPLPADDTHKRPFETHKLPQNAGNWESEGAVRM